MKTHFFKLIVALALTLVCNIACATTYTWVGGTGNWNDATKWYNGTSFTTNNGYPGKTAAGDIAAFAFGYPNSFYSANSVTLTATLPFSIAQVQTPSNFGTYGGTTITLNSGTVLTVTSGLSIGGTYGFLYDGLTFAGSGKANISGASTLTYFAYIIIGVSNTITFNAGANTTFSNSYCVIQNNGILNYNGTSASPITVKFADYGEIDNNGTLNATYTTIGGTNNNPTLKNTSNCNLTSSTISWGGQYGLFQNTSNVVATGTTFNLSANYTEIDNQNSFSATNCAFNLTGQGAEISNTTSNGNFTAITCPFVLSTQNGVFIANGTNSTFTAKAGSSISISSYQGYINNAGTFYCGLSNSACPVTLTGQGAYITNSGIFNVGSTSGITMSTAYESTTNTTTGTFTFQSDQYGSAYAGQIPVVTTPPVFTGTFYVERYLSAKRGYRFLSSPVYNNYTNPNYFYSINYVISDAYLTGTTGTGGGFDKTGNPTLYLFRENLAPLYTTFLNSNFRGINKINNSPSYNYTLDTDGGPYAIPRGNGFLFYFRGDRALGTLAAETTPGASATAATLSASGTLNQGSISVRDWYTNGSTNLGYTSATANSAVRGYNLVGNPYACPIDWETYGTTTTSGISVTSNISKTMYTFNPANGNYSAYTVGGAGVGSNGATNVIPSGEGFFVVVGTSATPATLTFNEAAKVTTPTTALFMGKPAEQATIQYLRLQLAKDSINTDDMVVRFDNSANPAYVFNEDAPYRTGFGAVGLCSVSSNDVDLAINDMPLPKTKAESIPLNVRVNADGTYKLNLTQIVAIPQLYDIWLMDAYKKDSLDMRHNPTYSFNVNKNDSTTFGNKRFSLVIRQNPAYAYHLLDFAANKVTTAKQVQLVWKTENEANYTHFTVERSTDGGKTYDVIGSQVSSDQATYSLLDKAPGSAQNLYRLKQVDMNGTITYSNIATVMYSNAAAMLAGKLNVYPNPASSVINLSIAPDVNISSYNISITNSSGLLIKAANSSQPAWQSNVNNLLPGTYLIEVVSNKDKSLVGKTKFVKL